MTLTPTETAAVYTSVGVGLPIIGRYTWLLIQKVLENLKGEAKNAANVTVNVNSGKEEEIPLHNCRFSSNIELTLSETGGMLKSLISQISKIEDIFYVVIGDVAAIKQDSAVSRQEIAELRDKLRWLEDNRTTIEATDPATGNVFVLFVDDRADLMQLATDTLKKEGWVVKTAKTYEHGLSELESFPYDFAILDASLTPGQFDGIQLAEECQIRFPAVKVIIYTGYKDIKTIPSNSRLILKGDFRSVVNAIKEWGK